MSVLYMIGAGCSKNYDQSISPVPNLKPPLNRDFFKMAKKIIDFYGLAHMYGPIHGLDHLIEDLNGVYRSGKNQSGTMILNDDRLDLESVMTHFYLEDELLDWPWRYVDMPGSRRNALNDLLAYTLAESLNGPTCPKHANLAEKMRKGDVIWNFNYDLLLDNALYEKGRFSDSGYIINADYTLVDEMWERTRDTPSDVTMLKLHGSLNWLKCKTCDCALLLRHRKSVQNLWTTIKDLPMATINCPKCGAVKEVGLERVIVPPSMVKSYREVQIRYLWKYASSIKNINHIVVIGFSFSEQDPEVEMLLRTMVERSLIPIDVPILIVNPHPKAVSKRFESIFVKSTIAHESPKIYLGIKDI